MQVVEHQHDGARRSPESAAQTRGNAGGPDRSTRRRERLEHRRRHRLDAVQGGRHVAQQDHGIVVALVERHGRERPLVPLAPGARATSSCRSRPAPPRSPREPSTRRARSISSVFATVSTRSAGGASFASISSYGSSAVVIAHPGAASSDARVRIARCGHARELRERPRRASPGRVDAANSARALRRRGLRARRRRRSRAPAPASGQPRRLAEPRSSRRQRGACRRSRPGWLQPPARARPRVGTTPGRHRPRPSCRGARVRGSCRSRPDASAIRLAREDRGDQRLVTEGELAQAIRVVIHERVAAIEPQPGSGASCQWDESG